MGKRSIVPLLFVIWRGWPVGQVGRKVAFPQRGSMFTIQIIDVLENGKKAGRQLLHMLSGSRLGTWLGTFAVREERPLLFHCLALVDTFSRGVWSKIVTFQNGLIKDALNWIYSWILLKYYSLKNTSWYQAEMPWTPSSGVLFLKFKRSLLWDVPLMTFQWMLHLAFFFPWQSKEKQEPWPQRAPTWWTGLWQWPRCVTWVTQGPCHSLVHQDPESGTI